MIISMFSFEDVIAITNRNLVQGDYLRQIKKVAEVRPYAVVLREKELADEAYESLAREVLLILSEKSVPCYIHSRFEIARKLGCRNIHISMGLMDDLQRYISDFDNICVSCHSLSDVRRAIEGGATQIILGTIFDTECKKGLKGKGLEFVKEICEYVETKGNIPVFAIGGIKPENLYAVKEAGARGGCMMSYMMELT